MANIVEILVTGKNLATPAFASARAEATGLSSTLTRTSGIIAAAFGVIGVEATKMATRFDSEMTKLNTQAGVSKDEIKGLSDGVLDLAGKVGESPDSLAESLFHVKSAFESTGISSKKALDLVKTAAEGARVGGANLVDVTNALTAAVASGIPGVRNLDQAMGVLNATVGVGDMKMQDLADAFGTGMVAVVKGYGLSIRDVGAALAVFGDNNIRGAQAGTQLRMAVQALARPAVAGKGTIEALGLSMNTLAHDMQEGGLNRALTDLKAHMQAAGLSAKQQGEVITTAFGKKAGTGINILIDQYDRLQSKYPALDAAADGFGAAWKATAQTTAQKVADLKAGFEALMIRIGEGLLPVMNKLVTILSSVTNFFEQNSKILTPLVAILGGAAAAFFLLSKAIAAVKGIKNIATDIGGLITKLRGMSGPALAATGGLGLLVTAALAFKVAWDKVDVTTHSMNQWTTALDKLGQSSKTTGPILDSMGKNFSNLASSFKASNLSSLEQISKGFTDIGSTSFNASSSLEKVAAALSGPLGVSLLGSHQKTEQAKADWKGMDDALASLVGSGNTEEAAAAFQKIADAALKQGISLEELHKKFPEYGDALSGVALQQELAAEQMGEFGLQAQTVQAKLQQQARAAEGLKQAIEDLNAVNRNALDAESAFEQAIDDAATAVKGHTTALKFSNGTINLNTQAARDAFGPLSDLAAKTDAAADAALKSGQSQDTANGIYAKGRSELITLAQRMGLTKTQAKQLADQILKTPNKTSTITVKTDAAKKQVAALKTALGGIKSKTITLTVKESITSVALNATSALSHSVGARAVRATGGLVSTAATGGQRDGRVLVGERGAEMLDLPWGAHVRSNEDSRRLMGGGGSGGQPMTLILKIGEKDLGELLVDPIKKTVRSRGGNVQAVFGVGG